MNELKQKFRENMFKVKVLNENKLMSHTEVYKKFIEQASNQWLELQEKTQKKVFKKYQSKIKGVLKQIVNMYPQINEEDILTLANGYIPDDLSNQMCNNKYIIKLSIKLRQISEIIALEQQRVRIDNWE